MSEPGTYTALGSLLGFFSTYVRTLLWNKGLVGMAHPRLRPLDMPILWYLSGNLRPKLCNLLSIVVLIIISDIIVVQGVDVNILLYFSDSGELWVAFGILLHDDTTSTCYYVVLIRQRHGNHYAYFFSELE